MRYGFGEGDGLGLVDGPGVAPVPDGFGAGEPLIPGDAVAAGAVGFGGGGT